MEELVDDEGIDLESLQAQIDLSLAQTQNLVASWLKPSEGASSTSTVHRIRQEMEIQELMKRPARLGVGAPIPASTGTLGLETMKLKGKLTGKKRAREAEDGGSKAAAEPSDDEEESRAGAIKKKARVDPFAPKAKKKQSGDSTLQVQGKVSKPTVSKLSPPSTPPRTKSPSVDAEAESVDIKSPVQATDEVSTGSPDKKKKKKKRKHKVGNKAEEGGDGNVETASVQEHGTAKSPTRDRVTKPALTADRPQTPPAVGSTELEVPETPATSSHTPHTPQANSTITPKSNVEVNGLPLLNLEGPPPALGASPAKKKRKRNKKKKKRHMEGGEAQVSADRDAEAQGEEEDDE